MQNYHSCRDKIVIDLQILKSEVPIVPQKIGEDFEKSCQAHYHQTNPDYQIYSWSSVCSCDAVSSHRRRWLHCRQIRRHFEVMSFR